MVQIKKYDVIIVGAGPAGLGAALYSGRALLKTLVLEKMGPGGQLALAYDVDNYLGFSEGITGPDLTDKMKDHAEKFGAEIKLENVEDLHINETGDKIVKAGANTYQAPVVVIASGASHRKLNVPGEDELSGAGVSYCATCDGAFFRDKKLIIVGGGDSALTEALFLTRFASHIDLIHRRRGFRGRPMNVENAREHEKISFILDSVVEEIIGDKKVEAVRVKNVKNDEEKVLDCDGVFVAIGHDPNTQYINNVLPEYAGKTVPVDMNMETDIKGLYAIGDVRVGSYQQVATAVADGVTAAMHAEKKRL